MRIRAIIDKELEEIVKNKAVFWSLALLPLLLTGIALGVLFFMHQEFLRTGTISSNGNMPAYLAGYNSADGVMIMILNQFMMYFFMAPLILPTYIAAYSVIGEKQSRTLEPLLATPIRTWELLLGKAVASTVPPVLVAWAGYAIFAVGARFLVSNVVFGTMIGNLWWVLAIGVLSPLFAIVSVLLGIIVSSRMNDARSAQQWTAFLIIPIFALGMAMMFGVIRMGALTFAAEAFIALALAGGALFFAVRIFQREAILTRWR
jgi:ABC-2 type transport system permease protein